LIGFTKRNLLVFFRDKASVFFSLLASFIIIGLYILFLGRVYSAGLSSFENAKEIMDNWVMAGLLSITTVTTTMGAFGIMINDKTRKINKDFISSPIKRWSISGGYVFSAFIIGVILSLVTLVLSQIYIAANNGTLIGISALIKVLGIILLSAFANTALTFFIISFINSENAFSTASTIVGTVIGFLTGIYIPIGNLPSSVQWVIKLFPPSHAASLLRKVMMDDAMTKAFTGEASKYAPSFREAMGITFKYGSREISDALSIIILLSTGALFFALAIWSVSGKRK